LTKAIIDTTILTDILLNSGEVKKNTLKALSFYDETLLPVYAIKEFKAGPLNNFVWMHNKLAILKSHAKALTALQGMSRSPKRYTTSTAIQALKEAAGTIGKQTCSELMKKYGDTASLDLILCDEFRLTIKSMIFRAWKKRRKITTDIIWPLACYREVAPYEKRGLIELKPRVCEPDTECSLSQLLRQKPQELSKMRDAIEGSNRDEDKRRAKVLRQLYRTSISLSDKECRNLGDAVFVSCAPPDAEILTTNTRDHKLLAESIGKKAISPTEAIKRNGSNNENHCPH